MCFEELSRSFWIILRSCLNGAVLGAENQKNPGQEVFGDQGEKGGEQPPEESPVDYFFPFFQGLQRLPGYRSRG
jgi:hypothetical protein